MIILKHVTWVLNSKKKKMRLYVWLDGGFVRSNNLMHRQSEWERRDDEKKKRNENEWQTKRGRQKKKERERERGRERRGGGGGCSAAHTHTVVALPHTIPGRLDWFFVPRRHAELSMRELRWRCANSKKRFHSIKTNFLSFWSLRDYEKKKFRKIFTFERFFFSFRQLLKRI